MIDCIQSKHIITIQPQNIIQLQKWPDPREQVHNAIGTPNESSKKWSDIEATTERRAYNWKEELI